MEPRREKANEELKIPTPASEKKPNRFRIVKLEERIAPKGCIGPGSLGGTCCTCLTCRPGHCR
jgi:hypothetical protein